MARKHYAQKSKTSQGGSYVRSANAGNRPLLLCATYKEEDGMKRRLNSTGEDSEFYLGTRPDPGVQTEPETTVRTRADRSLPKGPQKPAKTSKPSGSNGTIEYQQATLELVTDLISGSLSVHAAKRDRAPPRGGNKGERSSKDTLRTVALREPGTGSVP